MQETVTHTEDPLAHITEKQRKLLDELQDLSSLTDQDIFVLALVYLGLKPAAMIGLTFQEGFPDYTEQDYEKNIDEVRQFIQRMGLWYEQERAYPEENDEDQTIWTSFYVAPSPQKTALLHQAFRHVTEAEAARLLGYPETALRAFPENSIHELPTELDQNEAAPFLYFRPSKQNWAEEIQTVKESVQLIRQLMPRLYHRMLRDFSKSE